MGMKEYIIQIQEKENGNIIKNWDYGTEDFEKMLKDAVEQKIKEKRLPWYFSFFAGGITSFTGEALSEAIDYTIKETTKKPSKQEALSS
ncbi:MAG: hypothetical protein J5U17_00955 [Candidatus Methanoperedens sp.]|nr:hypothetical protein [Candidatus Methanoperedens sp.]MCE8427663.1 hypothetical protein [Candidatus Methanoperedens sp.]